MSFRTAIIYFLLSIFERGKNMIHKINGIFENPKTERIGFIVAVLIYVCLIVFTLFSQGCSSSTPNNFETLYKNSQASLEVSNQLLVQEKSQSLKAAEEYRQSEKLLRDSIDSLFAYSNYKTDSLYSVIAVKDILLRSNNADIDSMLYSINEAVINYINELRSK